MAATTRLHVVRHGRTAVNAGGRLLGRADPPLDAEGRRQAAAVAAHLATVAAGGRVVSSPLGRCRQTAAVIADALGADVEVDARWIELDYGELEGLSLAEVPAATWAAWRADTAWRPPGGETLAELGGRVRAACADLADSGEGHGDVDIVVVSHVSPIKAAVAWALDVDDAVSWRLYLAPGSLTRIAVRSGTPSLQAYNVTFDAFDGGPAMRVET